MKFLVILVALFTTTCFAPDAVNSTPSMSSHGLSRNDDFDRRVVAMMNDVASGRVAIKPSTSLIGFMAAHASDHFPIPSNNPRVDETRPRRSWEVTPVVDASPQGIRFGINVTWTF